MSTKNNRRMTKTQSGIVSGYSDTLKLLSDALNMDFDDEPILPDKVR